jgi:hypothetical protein
MYNNPEPEITRGASVRCLEVREVRPGKLAQLTLICARALLENNKGVRRLAPLDQRELDSGQVS